MSFRSNCYAKTPDLRVRAVPEMAFCMVYTPSDPAIYTLNSSAWLILTLCDGRSGEAIAHAYHSMVEPTLTLQEARREVRIGVEGLMRQRLIKVAAHTTRRRIHERRQAS